MADINADSWVTSPGSDRGTTGGLRHLVAIFFRRKGVVVWFAAGVMLVTLVALLTATPRYEVTASVLVKKGAAQVPLTPKDTPVWIADRLDETDINTEIGILESQVLMEETLSRLDETGLSLADPPPDSCARP